MQGQRDNEGSHHSGQRWWQRYLKASPTSVAFYTILGFLFLLLGSCGFITWPPSTLFVVFLCLGILDLGRAVFDHWRLWKADSAGG
jgi:hypothetical protein